MQELTGSFCSPKVELDKIPHKGGFGLFARKPILKGEVICIWGGAIYPKDRLHELSEEQRTHGIQVEEDIYLIPIGEKEPADCINHSCDPNAGLNGQICLVAMRDIEVGEEICFDYAMSDASDYDEFKCQCGANGCRKKVTGNDWKIPELQKKYYGYFMPYIQRRIDMIAADK